MLKNNVSHIYRKPSPPNKKLILISLIMVAIVLISVFFTIVFPKIVSEYTSGDSTEPVIINELNKTYTGDIIVTATDIKAIKNPSDNKTILVGVRFIIENNSSTTYNSYNTIECYVDDLSISDSNASDFDLPLESLDASDVAPGKKVMGYKVVKARKESKKIEIQFLDTRYHPCVYFVFDIPPVEE